MLLIEYSVLTVSVMISVVLYGATLIYQQIIKLQLLPNSYIQ